MKLLIFSDIHNDAKALDRLMKADADYYICAGDLVNFGRGIDAMGEILKQRGDRVWVIPGNHETTQQVSDLCAKFGLNDLHERSFEADGFHVIGLGYSNPTPFDTPGEYSEEQLAEKLRAFDGVKPMIAVCHAPPWGTMLDRITNLRHAGSTAVREFIQREQPRYFFCGHIHEAAGAVAKLGETSAMNVGRKGYLLDLEDQARKGLI